MARISKIFPWLGVYREDNYVEYDYNGAVADFVEAAVFSIAKDRGMRKEEDYLYVPRWDDIRGAVSEYFEGSPNIPGVVNSARAYAFESPLSIPVKARWCRFWEGPIYGNYFWAMNVDVGIEIDEVSFSPGIVSVIYYKDYSPSLR
jgi:hypothetical protein